MSAPSSLRAVQAQQPVLPKRLSGSYPVTLTRWILAKYGAAVSLVTVLVLLDLAKQQVWFTNGLFERSSVQKGSQRLAFTCDVESL